MGFLEGGPGVRGPGKTLSGLRGLVFAPVLLPSSSGSRGPGPVPGTAAGAVAACAGAGAAADGRADADAGLPCNVGICPGPRP
jgi:hypothetical protein